MDATSSHAAAQGAKVALGSDYTETYDVKSELDPLMHGPVTIGLPTGKESLEMGMIQHRLRKGIPLNELDNISASTVIMLATLSVVVRKAPDWWYRIVGEGRKAEYTPAPEEIHDLDLLWDIYGRYTALRATFPRHPADASRRQPSA